MKSVSYLTILAMIMLLLSTACKKEHSQEDNNKPLDATWSFKEGDNSFKGTVDSAYLDTLSTVIFLNLDGTADNGNDKLSLSLFGTSVQNGVYTSPQAYMTYVQNNKVIYSSDVNTADFSITISNIDTASVTGIFSGKVLNGNGATSMITDGHFTAPIKKSVIGTIPTGSLTVWAEESCNNNDPIEIFVGADKEFISTFTTVEPACGADGFANYTLPAGNYNITAVCNGDTTRDIPVLVLPNTCNKLKLIQ